MKELSIEEKAKRYDEAFGKARRYYDEYKNRDNILYVEDMEDMFPELKEKESDDEKTRKEITEFFKNYSEHGTWKAISDVTRWIDWLEKQGELVNSLSKGLDNAHDRIDGLIQNNNSLLGQLEKQDEQIPAWSEEDEENLNWFEKFFRAESVLAEGKDIPQDRYMWFNNLKERVQLKPKQEWSEEDERIYKAILMALLFDDTKGYLNSLYITPEEANNWIKSFKDRYAWKPSEEQIKAIRLARSFVTDDFSDNPTLSEILIELEKQLKKLREE